MTDTAVRSILARLPAVVVLGLSLYFAAVFGIAGLKTLLWMLFGFVDAATGTIAHALGQTFRLSEITLTLVMAGIGVIKLAVAALFILAVMERAPTVFRGVKGSEHEALDLAVLVGLGLTLLFAYPAWVDAELAELRVQLAHVLLLIVAARTSRYELVSMLRRATRVGHLEATS